MSFILTDIEKLTPQTLQIIIDLAKYNDHQEIKILPLGNGPYLDRLFYLFTKFYYPIIEYFGDKENNEEFDSDEEPEGIDIDEVMAIESEGQSVEHYIQEFINFLSTIDETYFIEDTLEFINDVLFFDYGRDFYQSLPKNITQAIDNNTDHYQRLIRDLQQIFTNNSIKVTILEAKINFGSLLNVEL